MFSTPNLAGVSTSDDQPVTVLPRRDSPPSPETLTVVNESGKKCFLSIDGGASWVLMPAGTGPQTLKLGPIGQPLAAGVIAKRVPGGDNVTGLFCYTF